jgi:mono/diheme cytochrome c family protein
MSKTRWIAAIAGAGVWLLALAPHAEGQTTIKREPVKPMTGVSGGESFKAYCSVCHGIGGKGDGPAAKALKVPPADLTQLAVRHDGKFPASAVKMTVIGEQTVPAHGSREMPMWGPLFRSVDTEPVAELRVTNIVKYLESIQEKR